MGKSIAPTVVVSSTFKRLVSCKGSHAIKYVLVKPELSDKYNIQIGGGRKAFQVAEFIQDRTTVKYLKSKGYIAVEAGKQWGCTDLKAVYEESVVVVGINGHTSGNKPILMYFE